MLHTIQTAHWQPGTLSHIKQVLRGKHGKEVTILMRMGGDVMYTVQPVENF